MTKDRDSVVIRYLHGWMMFVRAVYLARIKAHGAGKMSWSNAIKMGACYRFIVDGQFYCPPRSCRHWKPHGK